MDFLLSPHLSIPYKPAIALRSAEAWKVLIPPAEGLRAIVVIPAKDEAENLPATLAALAAQTTLEGQPLPVGFYEVLVLANNCTDNTAAVVRQAAIRWPQLAIHVGEVRLPTGEAHVGKARRLLMDEACRRLEWAGTKGAFIASTDADTRVAPDWLAATAAELAAGADAVGGRILTAGSSVPACPVRRYQLQDAAYYLLRARLEHLLDPVAADPWPRHHQHFGASLALTTEAYRRVGGLPVVPYLEDEALCQALLQHDLRLRHSPRVRVYTSSRQEGRVAVGLSWQLRQWAEMQQKQCEPLVDNPARLAAEWEARNRLRRLWEQAATGTLKSKQLQQEAHSVAVPLRALQRQIRKSTTFGHLWSWVQQWWAQQNDWSCRWPQVALSTALLELRRLLAAYDAQPIYARINPGDTVHGVARQGGVVHPRE
ncbi:glycosyltransferase [Hymenobacter mucosus]|uniref:Glycosyl transferase family 2 n=1 Tax=Hymenobacter mucosus TaxID=1411120 RepID=A0A238ZNR7_9BACT|nr:glycosyltransferase [Hymenobacter mucosus]SNR85007.1 Glycosyl transferase family 2 [Hymenobacter mucosus]